MTMHEIFATPFQIKIQMHQETISAFRIVVPNSIQMGWCESPPLTARDVIQEQLLKVDLPPHPFEHYMMLSDANVKLPKEAQDLANMMDLIEAFVDDFIGGMDNLLTRSHLIKFTRAMMHGMHSIFQPQSVTGYKGGGDPISKKKLEQLEGLWEHVKDILGWILDGANYTISLVPEKKVEKIQAALRQL